MKTRTVVGLVIVALILFAAYVYFQATTHGSRGATATSVSQHRVGGDRLYPPLQNSGAADVRVKQENIYQTICVSGYTATVRPSVKFTNQMKRDRMIEYDLPGNLSDYELDHVIPLELGGCPDCAANLWMEPWSPPGAYEKDRVENYLHREVCAGQMSLIEAQTIIAQDWYAVYRQLGAKRQ